MKLSEKLGIFAAWFGWDGTLDPVRPEESCCLIVLLLRAGAANGSRFKLRTAGNLPGKAKTQALVEFGKKKRAGENPAGIDVEAAGPIL